MQSRKLQVGIAVVVALAVVALFFVFNNPFVPSTMDNQGQNPLDSASLTQLSASSTNSAAPQSLVVQDETVGTGTEAVAGKTVVVQYTGRLQDGTVFDTSVGKPPIVITQCPAGTTTGICFTLGAGQVIPGWDQGVQGMKVGGKRLLIIPPDLAYGSQQMGPIPPNSTLTFEVELLNVGQ